MKFLQSRDKKLKLDCPIIMGILNVTPDSFSDGGEFLNEDLALERAMQMIGEGADIIDIGGESTGPDSKNVSLEEELRRVITIVKKLRKILGKKQIPWISVDTYKAEVAKQALEAGADMINDVTALRGDSNMANVLSEYNVPIVLMYSKDDTARTTRKIVKYDDVMKTIHDFLEERISYAIAKGVLRSQIVIDPGMGAFVSADEKYSLQILKRLNELKSFHLPILIGASRKSFIGQVLNVSLDGRLEGSLAAAMAAVDNGASILRVHDVKESRRVVDMINAIIHS